LPADIEEEIVEEFDLDIDKITEMAVSQAKADLFGWFFPIFGCLCFGPAASINLCGGFARRFARDKAEGTRLVLTGDSIVLATATHDSGCGLACQRIGGKVITVPVDRVTDVTLTHPAGGCIVRETLTTAVVQTAGSSAAEIGIAGLADPDRFRQAVLSMKAGTYAPGAASGAGARAVALGGVGVVTRAPRGGQAMSAADDEKLQLLRSINDSLGRIELHMTGRGSVGGERDG
jgi:hypothetical protein